MTSHARKWSELAAFAVAVGAALATLGGAPDPVLQPAAGDAALPAVDLLLMADRFEDQKRSASAADLPSQF